MTTPKNGGITQSRPDLHRMTVRMIMNTKGGFLLYLPSHNT